MANPMHQLRRRTLLAGLGSAGLGTLLLPLLRAEAQGTGPQRLLIIHRPCGTRPEKWFPSTGGVKDWATTPLLSSFNELRNDMVVLKGIDLPRTDEWPGDRHGAGMLAVMCPPPSYQGGWPIIPGSSREEAEDGNGKAFSATGPTVDQELLNNAAGLQGAPIASLQLGASLESMKGTGPECLRSLSYAGFHQPLWPEARPEVVFDNVFGGLVAGMADPAAAENVRLARKSVLDFVTRDVTGLRDRAPSTERPKLEAHLEAIRSLESQLAAGVACGKPALAPLPSIGGDAYEANNSRHARAARHQGELIKAIFQCDLTRVISLTYAYGNTDISISAFPGQSAEEGHHEASHWSDGQGIRWQEDVDKFYGDVTAQLLLDLKNTPEGSGTMLDNTLVLYFSECCLGNEHSIPDNPALLFGGKSLGLNGGSYLQYSDRTFADVWVETFRRFGYNKPVHGDPYWNRGALPGLYG
jgi:hypothetical protein